MVQCTLRLLALSNTSKMIDYEGCFVCRSDRWSIFPLASTAVSVAKLEERYESQQRSRGGKHAMDDIEAQIVLLQRLHAALSTVKNMGGPGVLCNRSMFIK